VTADFAAGDQITVADLGFTGFTDTSPADNLELEINDDDVVSATDDKTITVQEQLTLAKRAFFSDGTPVPDGSTLPAGITVKFMIYLNNRWSLRTDVSVRDVLDPVFLYKTATLKVNNSTAACVLELCTTAEETTIFNDVDAAGGKTDAVDSDEVSITGTTVDAGDQYVANAAVDIAAGSVWALLIQVTIQ